MSVHYYSLEVTIARILMVGLASSKEGAIFHDK